MKTYRVVVPAIWLLGLITFGCNLNHQNHGESKEQLNQVDRSGLKQGPWKIYSDSVLIAEGTYTNGKPDGLWTYWYKNGQMKEEGHYERGVKEGIWVEWHRDGQIMWKGEWKNGKRNIDNLGAKPEIAFIGQQPEDHLLATDSLYHMRIRIKNIPDIHLFVEVSSGVISREGDSDLFTLRTSSDSAFKLAVGYVPDLQFKDFRNLVSEIGYKLR